MQWCCEYLPLAKVPLAVADRLEETVPVQVLGRAINLIKLVEDFLLGEQALILAEYEFLRLSIELGRVRQAAQLVRVNRTLQLSVVHGSEKPLVERVKFFFVYCAHRLVMTVLHRGWG